MAALTSPQRADLLGAFMRDLSSRRDICAVNKIDLRAALDALDDYFVANAVAINQTIPQPARANLTQTQKALLLMAVISRRYLEGA